MRSTIDVKWCEVLMLFVLPKTKSPGTQKDERIRIYLLVVVGLRLICLVDLLVG